MTIKDAKNGVKLHTNKLKSVVLNKINIKTGLECIGNYPF